MRQLGRWSWEGKQDGRESRMACRVLKSKVKLAITTKDDLHKSINQTDTISEIFIFSGKKSAFKYRSGSLVVPSSSSDAFFWPWSIGALAWGHLTALSMGDFVSGHISLQHSQDEEAPGMSPIFTSQSALRCQACSFLVSKQSLEAWWQVIIRVK